jgi:glycosyltransferase involved in cell wall biosynthesis
MKKIAIFHPSNELYGADRIMVLAVKALVEYQPTIYLLNHGPLSELIRSELPHAKIIICPDMPIISRALFSLKGVSSTVKKYLKFKQFIKKEHANNSFDKFYVNTLSCSILLPALKPLNVPIITHVHEILENPKIAAKITAKLAFKYSETVISVSAAVQNNLHRLCKTRNAKSSVVHNGIPAIQTRIQDKNNTLTFYLFGRIKPEKGQWYLIEALKLIPKKALKDTKFFLVGGTLNGKEHLKTELEHLIKSNGLAPFVTLKGFTNDISKDMSSADVCLVPSLMKDPFPTTVLEAMSAGKTVISTNTGGAKEAIVQNETGLIIPPNEPFIFADAILKLINDRSLICQMGLHAKAHFNQNFTIDQFNTRWRLAI